MPPVTTIALKALANMSGPRIVLKAVPGGIEAVAREAGVSKGRVSQVLRKKPLPTSWAQLLASMIGCSEWEVYQQLEQSAPASKLGPLFDAPDPEPAGDGESQTVA